MVGLFITFEGIDGCGKSTQVWKTAKYLADKSKYNHVIITREPYKDVGIRKILQSENDPYSQVEKLTKLFVDDRKAHISEMITPSLKNGYHVISDRYMLSTLAYQQAQGIPLEKLEEMHKGMPVPDLTFLVDVPVEVAVERMKKDTSRKVEQKFEKNIEFIKKLRTNYLGIRSVPFYVIDGTKSIEDIFEKQIKPKIDDLWAQYQKNA